METTNGGKPVSLEARKKPTKKIGPDIAGCGQAALRPAAWPGNAKRPCGAVELMREKNMARQGAARPPPGSERREEGRGTRRQRRLQANGKNDAQKKRRTATHDGLARTAGTALAPAAEPRMPSSVTDAGVPSLSGSRSPQHFDICCGT